MVLVEDETVGVDSVKMLSYWSMGKLMTLFTSHSSSSTLFGVTVWYQNEIVSGNVTSVNTKCRLTSGE